MEIKDRSTGERENVPVGEVVAYVTAAVAAAKAALAPKTLHP